MKFECNCTSPEFLRGLWENTRSAHTGFAFEVAARLWYTPDGWNRSIMVEYQITTASGREMAENPEEPDYFTAYEVKNENDTDCSVEIASMEITSPVGLLTLLHYMMNFVNEIIPEYEMRKPPMKKNYKVIYTEIVVHHFYVEAKNEDKALEEFHRLVDEGKLDFSDGEIVDTDIVVELDDSNRGCHIPTQPRSTIDKVLTISSFHVSLDTSGKLDTEPAFSSIDLSVYPKADFGWWICIDPCIIKDGGTRRIPDDLMDCIRFAWKHDCTWLCLDCDGETRPELKTYEW